MDESDTIRELTDEELEVVSGGTDTSSHSTIPPGGNGQHITFP